MADFTLTIDDGTTSSGVIVFDPKLSLKSSCHGIGLPDNLYQTLRDIIACLTRSFHALTDPHRLHHMIGANIAFAIAWCHEEYGFWHVGLLMMIDALAQAACDEARGCNFILFAFSNKGVEVKSQQIDFFDRAIFSA